MTAPVLIAFGGLPGTGKTTVARAVAASLSAAYLRIDTIEQALRASGMLAGDVGPAGYLVGYAQAEANLRLGLMVVADSVNPLAVTRDAWRGAAVAARATLLEVELTCSDKAEHRRRVEERDMDVPGLARPTWQSVLDRKYEPWDRPRLLLDTAHISVAAAADMVQQALARPLP